MRPIKLVILTQYFPPEMGAPQSRLYELAIGLQEKGWDVRVVTAMPNYPTGKIFEPFRNKFSCSETLDGILIYRYWLYASKAKNALPRIFSMLSFSFTCLFSLRHLIRFRPDFILTESPPLTLGLSGLLLARIVKAQAVLNVSDIWPLTAYELGAMSKGWSYRLLERLEGFLYRTANICLGQSQQIVDHLQARGAGNAALFRNGVEVDRFQSHRPKNKTFETPLKIVYGGLLGVAQGILEMCQQIDFQLFKMEFHIYGAGAEQEELEQFLKQHPTRNIFYHGAVSREQMPLVLMQYDLTLIPLQKAIYGAVPSKIYEAMAAGLPIVFAGGGEGATIVAQYDLGWICEPSDFSAIKNTLIQIQQTDKAEIEAKRTRCIVAADTIFDRAIQIQQLHEKLSAVLLEKKHTPSRAGILVNERADTDRVKK